MTLHLFFEPVMFSILHKYSTLSRMHTPGDSTEPSVSEPSLPSFIYMIVLLCFEEQGM